MKTKERGGIGFHLYIKCQVCSQCSTKNRHPLLFNRLYYHRNYFYCTTTAAITAAITAATTAAAATLGAFITQYANAKKGDSAQKRPYYYPQLEQG